MMRQSIEKTDALPLKYYTPYKKGDFSTVAAP